MDRTPPRRGTAVRAAICAAWTILILIPAGAQPVEGSPGEKCGLASRLAEIGLTPAIPGKTPPRRVTAPSAYEKSRTIGRFSFYYDTSGTNTPALLDGSGSRVPGSYEAFVDSAGAVFNEVYSIMTGDLGYGDPIQPGQGTYDVNIFNSVYYGETVPETQIGFTTPSRWRTHINIDNDFQFFYSTGMNGLRVTAAHEFHHAIQFGVYGFWSTDPYFMELTSTWMEDVLYDSVNDYYQYIRGPGGPSGYTPRGHFAQPDFSFLQTDGLIEYSRAIFGKFIEKEYSRDVIRRTWELVPSSVAVTSLDRALVEVGSSFHEAFSSWARWNGETGPGADTVVYYSEGREYPPIRTRPRIDYAPPGRNIIDSIHAASAAYYPVGVADTVMKVIVVNSSKAGSSAWMPFQYQMADDGDNTYRQLANQVYVRLVVPDPVNWESIESVPTVVPPVIFSGVTPAPNPLNSGPLNFHIPVPTTPGSVRLKLLTPSMEEVYSGALTLRPDLSSSVVQVAQWDGADRSGRPAASGVFIYVLTVDGVEHTGKLAIVR